MLWGDIIVIGAIAAFIILRYRAMLGEQHGRNPEDIKREAEAREAEVARIIQLPQREQPARPAAPVIPAKEYPEPLASQFARMRNYDKEFSPEVFLDGAKAAFEMVITAFNDADRATLRELLAPATFKNFDEVLAQRTKENLHPHTTLVAITAAEISEVVLSGSTATVSVAFTTEQIQVVKNTAGEVVEGSASQVEIVEDLWKFERDLTASGPEWFVVQT